MQFTCTNCDQSYEISARAFGERADTRTRCPGCRTWLILTRNANDQLLATLDPTVAPPLGAGNRPPSQVIAPARAPSAPTAIQSRGPTQVGQPAQPNPQDNAEIFFTPRIRPGSAAEKLGNGMAAFALPDPAERLEAGKKKLQMQQVIQDFSVMFRLENKKSGRKQQVAAVAVALLAIGGLWWALQAKLAVDKQLDAAKDSKKLLAALVLQGGQAEQVAVLALPGDPTSPRAQDGNGVAAWPGTTVSRQCFLRIRQARAAALRPKDRGDRGTEAQEAPEPEAAPAEEQGKVGAAPVKEGSEKSKGHASKAKGRAAKASQAQPAAEKPADGKAAKTKAIPGLEDFGAGKDKAE